MASPETIALLEQCFTEEALRRMCRKAGVLSIARKSDLSLNEQIRSVALLMLRNVCSKAVIFLEHKRIKTLDSDIVDRSLKALAVKMPFYISEPSDVSHVKRIKRRGQANSEYRRRKVLPQRLREITNKRIMEIASIARGPLL